MPKVHELKLLEYICDDVLTGRKTFEIRQNDRLFQTGDLIKFKPVYSDGVSYMHPVADFTFKITYVASGFGLKDGYVVLGIQKQRIYAKEKK